MLKFSVTSVLVFGLNKSITATWSAGERNTVKFDYFCLHLKQRCVSQG